MRRQGRILLRKIKPIVVDILRVVVKYALEGAFFINNRILADRKKRRTIGNAVLTLQTNVSEMMFSRNRCLYFDGGSKDRCCIGTLAKYFLERPGKHALFGSERFCRYILKCAPELRTGVSVILVLDPALHGQTLDGITVTGPENLSDDVKTIFLCAANWRDIAGMRKVLPESVEAISLDMLKDIDWTVIPSRAWVPKMNSIYPIEIPEIEFFPDQELILLDFPARSLAQMPVGFGYVHMALEREGLRFQTVDLDIIIYHRYHSDRILDGIPSVQPPSGRPMPDDPWEPVHYLEWTKEDFVDYFQEDITEVVNKLIEARPKILACSLQQANLLFARRVVEGVRQGLPDVVVVVGGMSCLQPGAAKTIFPQADYTIVHEADLIVGPLVRAILNGEHPNNLPGVWSRDDTPDRIFEPGPYPLDLDPLSHPRYEWTDVQLYRNWNGYCLVPIVGSRGCRWSRCRFCAENFFWRARTPEKVADDLEYFYKQGFTEFVFNESDLHGDYTLIERMCDEILRRGLKIHMTAQLRCNKRVDKAYFRKLAEAGFVCLRFGVDGWSNNTLKIQRKGYSKEMIRNNLRDATKAGIMTEVNVVLGIPGETEEDIGETIEFLKELKPYIGRVPFVNPLMLFRGSEFWNHAKDFGIKFTENKEELYRQYPVAIPDTAWYSEAPYIDAQVRFRRYQRVVKALHKYGISTTEWTDFTSEQVGQKDADLALSHNIEIREREQSTNKMDRDKLNDNVSEKTKQKDETSESLQDAPVFEGANPEESGEIASEGPELLYSFHKYNLVRFRGLIYACPISLGHLDFSNENDRTQPGILIGETEAQTKRIIDELLMHREEDGKYIVFRSGDTFLGIPTHDNIVSVLELKARPQVKESPPPQLIGSYNGYNLVVYAKCVFAVPQSLGPLDLTRKEDQERPGIVVALTEIGVRKLIDETILSESSESPFLIESYRGYNLVRYQGQVLVVPISLGHLDLREEKSRKLPGIITTENRRRARKLVDEVVE